MPNATGNHRKPRPASISRSKLAAAASRSTPSRPTNLRNGRGGPKGSAARLRPVACAPSPTVVFSRPSLALPAIVALPRAPC